MKYFSVDILGTEASPGTTAGFSTGNSSPATDTAASAATAAGSYSRPGPCWPYSSAATAVATAAPTEATPGTDCCH